MNGRIFKFLFSSLLGLSVGYCNPSEVDDWSRLFTIFYLLAGSAVISCGIGVIVAFLITKTKIVQVEHPIGAFDIYEEADTITVNSVCRFLWYHLKFFFGWYTHRAITVPILCFIIWASWGTAFVIVSENYSFIRGLYWAVATMSAGGLQSPACLTGTGSTCDVGNLRGGIMGFYIMIGVPLYCVTLSQIARAVVTASLKGHVQRLLNKPIAVADFLFAANIISKKESTNLLLGEYILFELMRLGITNQKEIEHLKRKFHELDRRKTGQLNIEDLLRCGVVVDFPLKSKGKHNVHSRASGLTFRDSDVKLIRSLSMKSPNIMRDNTAIPRTPETDKKLVSNMKRNESKIREFSFRGDVDFGDFDFGEMLPYPEEKFESDQI